MSQEAQKLFLLKSSWNPSWKFVSWKKILSQSHERKRKLFTEKWNAILQNLRKLEVPSLYIQLYYSQNSVKHLTWGFYFNSKELTTFCLHGTLLLMFDKLQLWTGWGVGGGGGVGKFNFVWNCLFVSFLLLLFICVVLIFCLIDKLSIVICLN